MKSKLINHSSLAFSGWVISIGFFCYSVFLLIVNSSRGFDITDESFYILNITQPELMLGTVSFFGMVLRPLYYLVHGDIELFRVVGLLIIMLAAAGLGFIFYKYLSSITLIKNGIDSAIFCILLSCILVLHYYAHWWLLTPSYNWLALLATILVSAGYVLLIMPNQSINTRIFATFFIGFGGCISFLAKPTTALYLVFLGLVLLVSVGAKLSAWISLLYAGIISAALILAFGIFYFGNISSFIEYIFNGLIMLGILDAGQGLNGLFLGALYGTYNFFKEVINANRISMSYVYIFMWLALIPYAVNRLRKKSVVCKPVLFVSIIFLGAGFAPSIGTADNLIDHASISILFMGLSLVMVLQSFQSSFGNKLSWSLMSLLVFSSMILFIQIATSLKYPYRLPSINEQKVAVKFLNPNQDLYLDAASAIYANQLMNLATQAGWQRGMPLIDLTGATPGALVILDAKMVGMPWLLGGYSGSNAYADYVLSKVSPDVLKHSWILTAPMGNQKIDEDFLEARGFSFFSSREIVGELTTGHRSEKQILWRPKLLD